MSVSSLNRVNATSLETQKRDLAVDVSNATVIFRSDSGETNIAIERVEFSVRQGDFVALLGRSGCGKTTLLNLIAGLQTPTSGKVMVGDRKPIIPNRGVGYMWARAGLFPWRTVRRNVELGLEQISSIGRKTKRETAERLLDLVGLGHTADMYPGRLSQGMRQRVALARTLAPDPALLLMDEPFGALDAYTRLQIQSEFLKIWETAPRDRRKTVIFVTHDVHEAVLLADRVVVMKPSPGRIVYDKTIDLPRPRSEDLETVMCSPKFSAYQAALLDVVMEKKPRSYEVV